MPTVGESKTGHAFVFRLLCVCVCQFKLMTEGLVKVWVEPDVLTSFTVFLKIVFNLHIILKP